MIRRVVIVDPSEVVCAGLSNILGHSHRWNVVGTFPDLNRIAERVVSLRADVVIVNPLLAEYHKRSQVKTLFPEDIVVVALSYGYMSGSLTEHFVAVIDIFDSFSRIEQRMQDAVNKVAPDDALAEQSELSDREKEILVAVIRGMMNKEVAVEYGISIHTVISHRKNITRKTGIKSVSGLTVYALLNNLIDQSEIQ